MTNQDQLKFSILVAMLMMLAISTLNVSDLSMSVTAHENHAENFTSQWKIIDWNESSLLYWWPKAHVNATIGSLVNFTVILPDGQTTIPSDVNGTIEIGNFTDTVPNSEIASALSLSIWPWMPGLITFPNWLNQSTEAREAANGEFMNGSLTIENITYSEALGDTPRDAIKFTYQQYSGFQATTLVYDRETGVLLHAKTRAGNFKMELLLEASDFIHLDDASAQVPDKLNPVRTPSFTLLIFLGTLSVAFIVVKKKRK